MTKQDLRKHFFQQRQHIDNSSSMIICNHAISFLADLFNQNKSYTTIAVYYPLKNEISLSILWEYCWQQGKIVLLPIVCSTTTMEFGRFDSVTDLVKGSFDILEPKTSTHDCIDVMFVPGLSFDKNRNRLGYGAGFYDRYLDTSNVGITVGVCDSRCFVDELIVEEHDKKMDFIITDQGIY